MADGIHYYDWEFDKWLGSSTRAEMSLSDRAIYRDLLDHQAATESLPNDAEALARMALCSPSQISAFLERWGAKCLPVGGDDRRRNPKMVQKREAIIELIGKRSEAGLKGAEARWASNRGSGKGNAIANGKGNAIANGKSNAIAIARASGSISESESGSSPIPKGESEGETLPPLLDTEQFRRTWANWQQHHREIKKPITPKSRTMALKKLEAMGHDRAISAIEHSIANGWQGIFEPDRINRPADGIDAELQQAIQRGSQATGFAK